MHNPYEDLPSKSFWRLAVGARTPLQIDELWTPKFPLKKDDAVATLGSCFAQHISRALNCAGYHWLNSEPAPVNFPDASKGKYNYDVFSARVGNVYTVALLKQWVHWAFGLRAPSVEVWRIGSRFFDPFRPNIEPNGFASEVELFGTRNQTLRALRSMFENCQTFIFTLGLTEAWINRNDQNVYPICPGTIAGEFQPENHQFKNYRYPEIYSDLSEILNILKLHNPTIRVILTVSPVPLTATAGAEHVLVATTYSKSTLRAVAGDLAESRNDTDYFPSYEIISGFPFKGMFYETNMRSVSKSGVDFVMSTFLRQIGAAENVSGQANTDHSALDFNEFENKASSIVPETNDEVCEEIILDVFGKSKS